MWGSDSRQEVTEPSQWHSLLSKEGNFRSTNPLRKEPAADVHRFRHEARGANRMHRRKRASTWEECGPVSPLGSRQPAQGSGGLLAQAQPSRVQCAHPSRRARGSEVSLGTCLSPTSEKMPTFWQVLQGISSMLQRPDCLYYTFIWVAYSMCALEPSCSWVPWEFRVRV